MVFSGLPIGLHPLLEPRKQTLDTVLKVIGFPSVQAAHWLESGAKEGGKGAGGN